MVYKAKAILLCISSLLATASLGARVPHENDDNASLTRRMTGDGGFRRTGPAWFTSRPKVQQTKSPLSLPIIPPRPSNVPRRKSHSKLFQGYTKSLHSVNGKHPFKFKVKNSWPVYGKAKPSTYLAADFRKKWGRGRKQVNDKSSSSSSSSSSSASPGPPPEPSLQRRLSDSWGGGSNRKARPWSTPQVKVTTQDSHIAISVGEGKRNTVAEAKKNSVAIDLEPLARRGEDPPKPAELGAKKRPYDSEGSASSAPSSPESKKPKDTPHTRLENDPDNPGRPPHSGFWQHTHPATERLAMKVSSGSSRTAEKSSRQHFPEKGKKLHRLFSDFMHKTQSGRIGKARRWSQRRSIAPIHETHDDELHTRGGPGLPSGAGPSSSSSSGTLSRTSSGSSSDSFPSPPRLREPQKEPHLAPLRTIRPSTAKPPLHPAEPKPLPGGWDGEVTLKKPMPSRPKLYKGQVYTPKPKKGSSRGSTSSHTAMFPQLVGKKQFPSKKPSASQSFKKMYKIASGRISKPAHVNFKNRSRKPSRLQSVVNKILGRSYEDGPDVRNAMQARMGEREGGPEHKLTPRAGETPPGDLPPKKRPLEVGSSSSSSSTSRKQRVGEAEPNAAPWRNHLPPTGRPPLHPKAPRPLPGGRLEWDGVLSGKLHPSYPKVYKGEPAKVLRRKKKEYWPTPFIAEKNSKVIPKKVQFPSKTKSLTKGFKTMLHKVNTGRVTKPPHINIKIRTKSTLQKFNDKALAHQTLLRKLSHASQSGVGGAGNGQTSAQGGSQASDARARRKRLRESRRG